MTTVVDEKTYVLGYWFASDGTNDWYLIMTRDKDGEWVGHYTHRYNSGNDDPFSGEDEKSGYTIKKDKDVSEKDILEMINKIFEAVKIMYDKYNDYFLVQGNGRKFFEIAKTKDYLHFKEVQ